MRLRNWIPVLVSVVLLIAAGTMALLMNRSALRAADDVHRSDSAALGTNNATLSGAVQKLSAGELATFLTNHTLKLGHNDPGDRRTLAEFAAKSTYFRYGLVLTDLTGAPINGTLTAAQLPAANDPGYAPMRKLLLARQAGFSSVLVVGGVTALQAVAVPIVVGGAPAAVLIGYNEVAKTQLQQYVGTLRTESHLTSIVDSTGRVGASSDPGRLGTLIDPAIIAMLPTASGASFVEYRSGSTEMIAVVIGAEMPGGWAYVRTQKMTSFDGAVHTRSQTVNLTLLAMLLIGVIGITLLGYRTQVQRQRAEERFRALFQHAPDMVAVLDAQWLIRYSSPSAATLLGLRPGSMHGASVFDLVHPLDRERIQRQFDGLRSEDGGVLRLQCRVLDSAGATHWFEFTASNQLNNPALAGVVINARDVTDSKVFEQRLEHEALHDPLTGLPNRRRMQDALETTLDADAVAVLFIDLDGFKPVNDVHGHAVGDELLRQVADRLSGCIRAEDVLARVGGDEFVVLMPGITEEFDAAAMSERFRAALSKPFDLAGTRITIGASVGVHLAASAADSDQALRAADHAMYAVKKGNGNPGATVGRHRGEA